MQIERKTDEKGKEIFCIGSLKFYNLAQAEKILDELKELKKEEDKKKKAEKTDLMKEVKHFVKEKAETNNETNEETKNNGRDH